MDGIGIDAEKCDTVKQYDQRKQDDSNAADDKQRRGQRMSSKKIF